MTQILFAALGRVEQLAPFLVVLANECGLAGLSARLGPAPNSALWLGLLPQPGPGWKVQTWTQDSVGETFRLASELHRGLLAWLDTAPKAAQLLQASPGRVSTVWPDLASPVPPGATRAIVSLPDPAVLVRDGVTTAVAARIAKAVALILARHAGVAGQQLITAPIEAMTSLVVEPAPPLTSSSPAITEPAPVATPPAPAVTTESSDKAPHPDRSGHDQPSRYTRQRLERTREGRQGSRTYEHPPWRTSEYLLPSPPKPGPADLGP